MPSDTKTPSLTLEQVIWLNQIAGTKLAPPQDSQSGGTPVDRGKLIKAFFETELQDRLEREAYRDEQTKQMKINDAIGAIGPMKKTLRDYMDIKQQIDDKTYVYLDNNTENEGDTQDITTDTVITRSKDAPLPKEDKKPKKAPKGKTKEEWEEEQEKARNEKKKQLLDNLADINKEVLAAFKLITMVRKDLQALSTTRSELDGGKIKVDTIDIDDEKQVNACFSLIERPLFTIDELMAEIYTPLVQERVLPETFITDEFSKTQKMIDATNKLYMKDLKDAKDPASGLSQFSQALVDLGGNLADGILQCCGADTASAKDLVAGCTALLDMSITAKDKLGDKIDKNAVCDLLGSLGGVVGDLVGGATGNTTLGDTIGGGGGVAANAMKLVVSSAQKGKFDKDAFATFLQQSVLFGFTQIDTNTQQQDQAVALGTALLTLAGKVTGKYATAFETAIRIGDKKKLRSVSISMCLEFAKGTPALLDPVVGTATGSTTQTTEEVEDSESDQQQNEDGVYEETGDALDEVIETIDEGKEGAEETADELKEAGEAAFDEIEKKLAEKEKELKAKDPKGYAEKKNAETDFEDVGEIVKNKMEEDRKAFKEELEGLNDPIVGQKTIEKLIKQVERDRMIMNVAVAIGKGGFAVASHFCGPAAIGTEAVQMAANITAAVQRAMDLRKFIDEAAGASSSASPYLTSIQNFADNQKNQLDHYSLAAAMNGAKIAAAAVATAFPLAAPALVAVSAAQAGAEALYQFYSQQQVVKAWNTTRDSLKNPKNRRLALKARRVNATLAKYAIAYGAVEEKDPVAVHMANTCKIDNDTLKNKGTNVDKVKIALEKIYAEDPKVAGHFEATDGWTKQVPEAELSVTCVYTTYKAFTAGYKGKNNAGYVKLFDKADASPPGELIAYVKTAETTQLTDMTNAKLVEERLLLVGQVGNGFRAEKARLDAIDGIVAVVLDGFVDLAEGEQEKLAMALVKLKVDAAKKSKTNP
jgi:hypothetical protein